MPKNYAELIIESILKEDVRQMDVIDAIKKRYEVGINYKADDEAKGSGYRIIQPVAYGKTSSGNMVIRAFQPYGDTKTKIPHWKMFRLDRIEKWKPMKNRKFSEPPSEQFNSEDKFNPNGDKSMAEVYLVANFNGKRNDALMKYNQKVHDKKTAENPYYDLQKNIRKSIDGNQFDYIRKNVADWQKSDAAKEFRKGNGQSVYDMSKINDFGDDNDMQTVGPIRKGNTELNPQNDKKPNYNTASNNGPIYKQNMKQQMSNAEEYDDMYDNADENEDTDVNTEFNERK